MTLLALFTKNMAFEDSNQNPCDYPGIFFTHIMASMEVSSTTDGAIAACIAASCRRRCWWSFQARCSRKAALFRRSWSDCGAEMPWGFWGHGIWGFLKAAKKRMRGTKTLGVHIVLENNSVIILYSVIWCCMVNCQRRVLATLRYTSRNHFCIRFTQHIQGATSS